VFIDPFKKRLTEYPVFFDIEILALLAKPLQPAERQRLGDDRINLIGVSITERMS
jgi:hypothetical protein